MATVKEIYELLDQKAPFRYQEPWDNAGFLVGRGDRPVTKALVALDVTVPVILEAVRLGCQLIVSHHPVIWNKLGAVTDQDENGRKVLLLLEYGIAVISAHTNLDAVEGGVNSVLAQRLGLADPVPLEVGGQDENGVPYGIGRVGTVQPVNPHDFANHVKLMLGLQLDKLKLSVGATQVRKVAVGGGACGSMLPQVAAMGCDTFVTSDVKHDQWLEAKALEINLLDCGHYTTEALICPVVRDWIAQGFPGVEVMVSDVQEEVFAYF